MAGDTVECYNCGNANPAWAQVCRSCGTPIRPGRTRRPEGPFPTDQDSLVAIGAGIAAIVLAVIVGVIVSGMLPEALVAAATPSPTPVATRTPVPTEVPVESVAESLEPTPEPTPQLIGTVTFGLGLNQSTREVLDLTESFGPGTAFCHSISLSEPFGVSSIQEEVLKVGGDGSLTVVQPRETSKLGVVAGSTVAGFCAPRTNSLISGWGVGDFLLRDYRGSDTPELIAEGSFKLTN
jgi:ribosomal protein L40E